MQQVQSYFILHSLLQKSHWPKHKKTCNKPLASSQNDFELQISPSGPKLGSHNFEIRLSRLQYIRPFNVGNPVDNPINNSPDPKSWLLTLSEKLRYEAIIDAYRFLVDEEYESGNGINRESLYGCNNPLSHFLRSLRLARRNSTFSDKWGARNKTECEALALEEDDGVCILHAVGKEDIV